MRLLTHNSLRSYVKDVTHGFPLMLEVGEMEVVQTDCNADFMQHMLPSLSWSAVLVAATAVGMQGIPETLTPDMLEDEDFLLKMHKLLLDIHVIDGALICPESGRRFPISERIPDMRVDEEDL